MTELEKIAYAKSFIDKLANGINPIDDTPIPDGDVVNNVRLSRCFFYVSDVLRQVIDNGGISPSPAAPKEKKPRKRSFSLTPEQAAGFPYSDTPITATEMIDRLSAIGEDLGMKKFPRKNLVRWLICAELLEEIEINNNRVRRPTEIGEEIGILIEEREGQYGSYHVVLYSREAQQFIIDNLESILALENSTFRAKMNLENQGKRWEREEDERLLDLFNAGVSVSDIATALKRGVKSILIRLRKKGVNVDALFGTGASRETYYGDSIYKNNNA